MTEGALACLADFGDGRRAPYKFTSHALGSPYNRTKFSCMLQTCMTIIIPLSNLSKNEKHIVFDYILHQQHLPISLTATAILGMRSAHWEIYESINKRLEGFSWRHFTTEAIPGTELILIGCFLWSTSRDSGKTHSAISVSSPKIAECVIVLQNKTTWLEMAVDRRPQTRVSWKKLYICSILSFE